MKCSPPILLASGPPTHINQAAGQPSFDKQFVRDYLETLSLEQDPSCPSAASRSGGQNDGEVYGGLQRLTGRAL